MKVQKNLLIVTLVYLIGSVVAPMADSHAAIRDEASIIIYETGIRSDLQFKLVDDEYTKRAKGWITENYKNKKIPDDVKGQNQLLLQISTDIKLPHQFELLFHFVRSENR